MDPEPHSSQNSGVLEAQNGALDAYSGGLEAQNGAVDAHSRSGGLEAQNGALEGLKTNGRRFVSLSVEEQDPDPQWSEKLDPGPH